MSDNVTSSLIPDIAWSIPIIAAFLGAAVALLGKELIEWWRRPRLEIDFERGQEKPYTPDYNDETNYISKEFTHRTKYFRLIVKNNGMKPAMGCEAKLELLPDGVKEAANKVALHWSRNDPQLYSKYEGNVLVSQDKEKIFAPISLNRADETVDVFQLDYHFSTKPDIDHSFKHKGYIVTVSPRQLIIQPNSKYFGKVTIYTNNANPESFRFITTWDGTVEGFNKAFTKA